MIVEFDATIDDFVDVTIRSLARSKTVRTWHWQTAITIAFIAAFPAYFLFSGTSAVRLAIACGFAVVAVVLYFWTSGAAFNRRVYKLCREQISTDDLVRIKVEINDKGISFSQMDSHTLYEWSSMLDLEEVENAIYFYRRDGSCMAVRKHGFENNESQNQFIQLAKSYIESSRSGAHSNKAKQQ
jgi:hypothetical protein